MKEEEKTYDNTEETPKTENAEDNVPSAEAGQAENQEQQQEQGGGAVNDEQLKEMAVQVLKSVYDPEIPVDIYELGLIYEVTVYPVNNLFVKMTLTSPACPVAGTLPSEVETKLAGIKGVNNVDLELTFEPPWDMSKMSEEAKLELGLM